MRDLFDLTLQHQQTFNEMINAKTQNWEQDRIAMVDILLMRMALCELLYFPYIPVKVSINEYLELAKLYSTPNSHGFINGVLDKIQLQLKAENKISKQGRGLVE
jgi:N utilization substance protein B